MHELAFTLVDQALESTAVAGHSDVLLALESDGSTMMRGPNTET